MKKTLHLVICITIPLVVGGISGYITSDAIQTWYLTLNKPNFNPPNWIFGPVWTLLYLLMGISKYLIDRTQDSRTLRSANIIYYTQLVLNFFWSILFFSFKNPKLALIEIIILWLSIAYMIVCFYKLSKTAGLLNIPYLLWVSFASVLTGSVVVLN